MALQGSGRSSRHSSEAHSQGHHQVPTPLPDRPGTHLALRRSALSSGREPLRHAARGGTVAGIPGQPRLRRPHSPPHRPGARFGPASSSRQCGSAAAGPRGRQQPAERLVAVVAELYGQPLDKTIDIRACRPRSVHRPTRVAARDRRGDDLLDIRRKPKEGHGRPRRFSPRCRVCQTLSP